MVGHTPPTPEECKIAMDKAFEHMAKVLMRRNAAEEMYEALKALVGDGWYEMSDEDLQYELSQCNEMVRPYISARAAIAKAEGR